MAKTKGVTSKTAVWVIVILLIVGLAGFGATNFGGTVRNVGHVGETPIDVNRYARELQQEITAFSAQLGTNMTLAQAQQFGIDRAVLQRIVSTVALENEAAELGLSVGDAVVGRQILEIPAFQGLDGGFDRDAYAFALERAGLSEAEFEADLRAELARSMLQGAVSAGVGAPPAYTDTILTYVAERRDFDWAVLGVEALDAEIAAPGEDDLRAHYEANPDDFMLPETKKITYAALTPDMIVDSIEINEDALQQLYQERIDDFVTPERRLVERLIFRDQAAAEAAKAALDAGEREFEDLVEERELSLSDIDLGDVTEAELGAAGPAVFALEGPGIAGPVDTDLGPALFRMNGILAAQETPFEDARDDLLDEFALDAARRDIENRIDNIDDLLAGGATLEELAQETDMQLGRIDWTATTDDGMAAYAAFRDAAMAAAEGDFPEVIALEDGGVFALRVDEVVAPRLRPFEDARGQAESGWRAEATAQALAKQAEALAARLRDGAAPEELGLTLTSETDITRDGFVPDTPTDFIEQVFSMDAGEIRVVVGPTAAYLVRLNAVNPPDPDDADIAARKRTFEAATAQAIGADILQAYTQAIETQAGISLNQAAINAVHANFP